MSEDKEDVPWFGVIIGKVGQEVTIKQLPEKFLCVVHESATKETGVMGVEKIRLKAIDMRCQCGHPNCTLRIRWRAEKSGHHPLMDERG